MKKLISLVMALAISVLATQAMAGKMDLMLKMGLGESTVAKAMLGKSLSERGGVEMIDVLIKSTDVELTSAGIEDAGGVVRSIIGDIMTAFIPVAFLETLDGYEEVLTIEASTKMRLLMDSARSNTGVAEVQDGSADGTRYTGANVIVGAIDSGLDYSRNDFMDSDFENTRVQYLRFQSVDSEGEVTITECKYSAINGGTCLIPNTNDSVVGHGTHILGIAAGNGGNTSYIGCATGADIMLVRNDFNDDVEEGTGSFTGGILDGVTQIFEKADEMDKPAVINISQGTHIGAHDNTSLMEQGINNAVLGQYATDGNAHGRSVVVAAGNEHIVYDALSAVLGAIAGGIHAEIDVPDTESRGWRFWVLGASAPGRTPLIMDMWFGTGEKDNCSVAAFAYEYTDARFTGANTADEIVHVGDLALATETSAEDSSPDNTVEIAAATDPSDSQNSKPRAMISFGPGDDGSWSDITMSSSGGGVIDDGVFLDIVVRASGGDCTGNMWVEGGGTLVHFLKELDTISGMATDVAGTGGYNVADNDGDNNKSVGIPGTASGAITVGAYLQEKAWGSGDSEWTGMDGVTYDATDVTEPAAAEVNGGTVGSRTPFSSIGPAAYTYSGFKPDVLAPGDPIISVLASGHDVSTAIQVDTTHVKSQGTSQASPHVAGLVALMYEKNNTLTAAQVKSALTTGAGGAGDSENGYGKINAVTTISGLTADSSGYSGTGNLDGDSSSSSGCGGTIAPAGAGTAGLGAMMLMLPGLLIAIRRRRS
jgi:minor extracellular serine protease Vpr